MGRSQRRKGIVVLVACLTMALSASAARALNIGINAGFPVLNDRAPQNRSLLSLHARQWREEMTWNPAAPGLHPGPHDGRDFASPSIAAAARYAMEHGAKLVIALDLPDGLEPAGVDVARYAAWVGSIARYFRPDGPFQRSLPCAERTAYSAYVPDLELLNEPYTSQVSTPADYARIVAAASAQIRRASGASRIVISGDLFEYGSHQDWIDGLYRAGLQNAMFDLVTVHTYGWAGGTTPASPPGDFTLQRLTTVIDRFRAHGFAGRFIVGEHGSPTAGYTVTPQASQNWQVRPAYAGLAGQLRFWQESMAIFANTPLYRDNIETIYPYSILDQGNGGAHGGPLWRAAGNLAAPVSDPGHGLFERYFGLFGWEGKPFQSPLRIKPAGAYLARLIAASSLPAPTAEVQALFAAVGCVASPHSAATALATVSRSYGWAALTQLLP